MDGSRGGIEEAPLEAAAVRRFLADNPEFLREDQGLLDELGLKVAAGNVVDFGPAALARVHADLAARLDHLAQHRVGLACGVIALEGERAPAGWKLLVEGQVDMILGDHGLARMGVLPTALGLFDARQSEIQSMALVRMAIWEPARQGLLAFGSRDPDGFTPDMGSELVAFLARVVERTAERWPLI